VFPAEERDSVFGVPCRRLSFSGHSMVIQWSFDRYRVLRVLRSENPKLKVASKTEGSGSWLPAVATFSGRSLGKSVVPYCQIFCLKKQENPSWHR